MIDETVLILNQSQRTDKYLKNLHMRTRNVSNNHHQCNTIQNNALVQIDRIVEIIVSLRSRSFDFDDPAASTSEPTLNYHQIWAIFKQTKKCFDRKFSFSFDFNFSSSPLSIAFF